MTTCRCLDSYRRGKCNKVCNHAYYDNPRVAVLLSLSMNRTKVTSESFKGRESNESLDVIESHGRAGSLMHVGYVTFNSPVSIVLYTVVENLSRIGNWMSCSSLVERRVA